MSLKLYSYWRSSASYRVRIALALKKAEYEFVPIDISKGMSGEQYGAAYRAINPQSRVPFLVDGDFGLGQSLAILEYLESKFPQPALIPADAKARARMWAFCHTIAGDIQPLQNTGPLAYLTREFKISDEQKNAWIRTWIEKGLSALEQERGTLKDSGFVFGDAPTLADCLLVPQVYNAERFSCDVSKFPRLFAITQRLREHPAFAKAHPDRQPDAPKP
ncbi:MAG TPA: maleylacetoacetate isomerase [Nevskiaceae bacterium]|nr:maleylacetoacetate isomerase [Nevskiaceae bacterium]